jgi:tetratricopeptide (TPR) repeat protein
MRTWDCWVALKKPGPMDLEHYETIGGMGEALSRHADQAYDELTHEQRRIAETIFRRLTERGPDNREIRRPTELRELCAIAAAPEANVVPVIDNFRHWGRAFLMPPDPTELHSEHLIDIAHESLIRHWKQLQDWVQREARLAERYRLLAKAAERHQAGEGGLLTGLDLEVTLAWWEKEKPNEAWARTYDPSFTAASAFLHESKNQRDAERARKAARGKQKLLRTRLVAAGLLVLLAVSTVLLLFAQQSKARAVTVERLARLEALRANAAELEHASTLQKVANLGLAVSGAPPFRFAAAMGLASSGSLAHHDSAVAEYGRVLKASPRSFYALVNRCDEQLSVGQADSAIATCRLALRENPRSFLVYLNLAVGYSQAGRLNDAKVAYDSALATVKYGLVDGSQPLISPELQQATGHKSLGLMSWEYPAALRLGRAAVLAGLGDRGFPGALKEADAFQRSPEAVYNVLNWTWLQRRDSVRDYGVHAAEGALWERVGERGRASSSYRRFRDAYHAAPESRYASLDRWVARRQRRLSLVPLWLDKSGNPPLGDTEFAILMREAQVLLWAEATDSVLDRANAALELEPDNLAPRLLRVQAFAGKLDSDTNAVDSLRAEADTILARQPELAEAYFYRALALTRKDLEKHRQQVLADLEKTVEYDPTHHIGHRWLAELATMEGADETALHHLRRVADVTGGTDFDHTIYYEMAVIQNRLAAQRKDSALFEEARRSINMALALKRDNLLYFDERAKAEAGLSVTPTEVRRRLSEGYRRVAEIRERQGQDIMAAEAYVGSALVRCPSGECPGVTRESLLEGLDAQLSTLERDVAHYGRASFLNAVGRYRVALREIEKAITLQQDTAYYVERAKIEARMGRAPRIWQSNLAYGFIRAGDVSMAEDANEAAAKLFLRAVRTLVATGQIPTELPAAARLTEAAARFSTAMVRMWGSPEAVTRKYRTLIEDPAWPSDATNPERQALRAVLQSEADRLSSHGESVSSLP